MHARVRVRITQVSTYVYTARGREHERAREGCKRMYIASRLLGECVCAHMSRKKRQKKTRVSKTRRCEKKTVRTREKKRSATGTSEIAYVI